jgi:hypothetical protein
MTATAFSPDFKSKNPAESEKHVKIILQNRAEGLARIMSGMAHTDAA